MTVLMGFQVYELTHNTLYLAWLGLIEAVPGVSLVLYGGHVADRHSRRQIMLIASALLAALVGGMALVSGQDHRHTLFVLFLLAFLAGVIRAFEDPAASGLEAQVIPIRYLLPGIALLATTGRLAEIMGPVVGGFAWATLGPACTYLTIAMLFTVSCTIMLLGVPEQTLSNPRTDKKTAVHGIAEGVRYVMRDQVLLGSMLLDLFAVFFGGATALLPVFATTVLHVGPVGFGLLRSASAAGALTAALLASRLLPQHRAGRALLAVVGGFGISIVVFGLSRSLLLSLAALFVAGLCDGISVIIRRTILRLASPEDMRGRIAAVKSVFVGSSNELGAFESGMAATLLGASAAVWGGGLVTLAVVGVTAWCAPRLRQLDLVTFAQVGPAKDSNPSRLQFPNILTLTSGTHSLRTRD
jgi:MFS family permease